MTARKGVSVMQLSKEISVQYRTAWYMLHRICRSCENVGEMDESYTGEKEFNKHADKKLNAGRGTVARFR